MAPGLAEVIERASSVLAELRAVDLDGLADDTLSDTVLALQRLRGALDAGEARVLSRWDAQRCWQASGAKTGAAWLAWQQRIPIQVGPPAAPSRPGPAHPAGHRSGLGHGEIDRAHITTLLGARTPRTAEAFDDPTATAAPRPRPRARLRRTSSRPATAGRWSSTPTAPNKAPTPTGPPARSTSRRASGHVVRALTLDPISGRSSTPRCA